MARRCFPGVPGTSCTAPTELSFARLPPFFKWPPLRSSRRQWQLISRGFGKTSAAINCTPCPPCQSPPCHKTKCGICVLQLGYFFFLFNSYPAKLWTLDSGLSRHIIQDLTRQKRLGIAKPLRDIRAHKEYQPELSQRGLGVPHSLEGSIRFACYGVGPPTMGALQRYSRGRLTV